MKPLRALLTIGSMLVLSASTMTAQGTSVTCKDGSKSAGGQGACSGHGGISSKATAKTAAKAVKADAKADAKAATVAAKSAKPEVKAAAKDAKAKVEAKAAKTEAKMDAKMSAGDNDAKGATAVCKDKTYSHAKTHQGACSAHGGVAKFLDGK